MLSYIRNLIRDCRDTGKKLAAGTLQKLRKGAREHAMEPTATNIACMDNTIFSDDVLRVAAAVRRTSASEPSASAVDEVAQALEKSSFTGQAGFGSINTLAEIHLAASKHSTSTADRAVYACSKLSRKPISAGGLGPYFLTEVFRRANLAHTLDHTRHNAPVSSHIISSLPSSGCNDPSACCPVCLKDFKNEVATLPCAHFFHRKCIMQWLHRHNSCPCCRAPVEPSDSSPVPHWISIPRSENSCSRLMRQKKSASELALVVGQWDGMTHGKIAVFASSAENLLPVAALGKRKHR